MSRDPKLTISILKMAEDSLERVGCQFFACSGPDKPPEDMKTCHVCRTLREIRAEVTRIKVAK